MSNKQQQRVDNATCDVVCGAHHGNVNTVRTWLLGDGRDNVNKQAVVLYRAAARGHTGICQLVIDCKTVSTDDLTYVLCEACYYGHLSVVQLIASTRKHNCNTQLLNESLHIAASRCHTEVMNWLLPLTHPTDADYMRWDLVQACARDNLTRITQLVNTIGRDVTDVMSHALWTACCWGRVDIVDWLMTHTSADVHNSRLFNTKTGNMTSLAVACYQGHMKVVKRLLANDTLLCDVNMATGKRRNTALHEITCYTRWSPLHKACSKGDTAAVVDVMYESDVNMQDGDGATAMHIACMNGHLDTVKVLLSVFADINVTDDYGDTPVALCEYCSSPELAHYIQHNHPMYVSGDDDDNGNNVTVDNQADHHSNSITVSSQGDHHASQHITPIQIQREFHSVGRCKIM
jgi:ankyrin repeat protein